MGAPWSLAVDPSVRLLKDSSCLHVELRGDGGPGVNHSTLFR